MAENIAFFDPDRGLERVIECARTACVHDEITGFPMGYDTLVGEMGATFSRGQKQRIFLARALYHRPRILILDEGTANLDAAKEAEVNTNLAALRLTRIMVAHRPETIASARRVVELRGGQLFDRPAAPTGARGSAANAHAASAGGPANTCNAESPASAESPDILSGLHLTGGGALLAGCAHHDDPHKAPRIAYQQSLPEAYVGGLPAGALAGPVSGPITGGIAQPDVRRDWWRSAGDPLLDKLVGMALVSNNDRAAAAARIGQASALARAARGAQLGRVDAGLDGTRSGPLRGGAGTAADTVLGANINLGWDPDLFGKLRADRRAARAELRAARLELEDVRRIVVNDLVRAYVSYRLTEARLVNTELSRKAQQEIMDTIERRYQLGLAVETDREQARLQLLQVRALVPRLVDERNQLRARIAILMGEAPQNVTALLRA